MHAAIVSAFVAGGIALGGLVLVVLALCLGAGVHLSSVSARRGVKVPAHQQVPRDQLHMVTFGTRGAPHDAGKDMSTTIDELRRLFQPYVGDFRSISPSDLPPESTSSVTDHSLYPHRNIHCRAAKHHFWRWKSELVLQTLESMPEGHVLLYSDCDTKKYPALAESPEDVSKACAALLRFGGGERWMGACFSSSGAMCDLFCDARMLRRQPSLRRTMQVSIPRIVFRNIPQARAFVREWRDACRDPTLLYPDPDPAGAARWVHLHDQSVFNFVAERWRQRRTLPKAWPNAVAWPERSMALRHLQEGAPSRHLMQGFLRMVAQFTRSSTAGKGTLGHCEHKPHKQ